MYFDLIHQKNFEQILCALHNFYLSLALNIGEIISDFQDHKCTAGSLSNKTVCGLSIGIRDEYVTLRDAVASLVPGSTLNLKAGYYTGSMSCGIIIAVNHIKIASLSGVDDVVIDCAYEDRHFIIDGDNVTLVGLRLVRGFSSGSAYCSSTKSTQSICSDGGSSLINSSSSVIINHCRITACSALQRGGAISISTETTQVLLNSVVIQFCSASSGGGIWTNGSVSLINTLIESNSAILDGGGIFAAKGAAIVLMDQTSVVKNNAGRNGSALYLANSLLNASNNVSISKNYAADAGTIFAKDNAIILLSNSVLINENQVLRHGAGIYLTLFSTLNISRNVSFVNNYVANLNGGAIFGLTSVRIFVSENVLFKGNTAGAWGGSIHLESYSTLHATRNISFLDNLASYFSGGAIYAVTRCYIFLGHGVTLVNNTARNFGGAIALESDSILTISNNVFLNNNNAIYSGGAIYGSSRVAIVLSGNICFDNNTGVLGGGGISLSGASLKAFNSISFQNNLANHGGAIHASDSSLTLDGEILIKGNRAQMHGGGIWLTTASLDVARDCFLESNLCGGFGGAIYAEQSSVVTVEGTVMLGNTASSGGALVLR